MKPTWQGRKAQLAELEKGKNLKRVFHSYLGEGEQSNRKMTAMVYIWRGNVLEEIEALA